MELTLKDRMDKARETKHYIGEAFKLLAEGKTVTGMQEGAAADGGALVYTGISDVMGIAIQGSQVYAKVRKITLGNGQNSIKVPVDANDYAIVANAPVMTTTLAEGAEKTPTKLQFGAQTLTLDKHLIPIAVTSELLEDVAGLDQWIRQAALGAFATKLDREILIGSGSIDGIVGNSGYASTQSVSSTPTVAELYGFVTKIHPMLRKGSEWFISNALWATIVAALGTSNNVQSQLIDIAGMKLFGFPVTISTALNAEIVFGNLSQYCIAERPLNVRVSDQVRFLFNESIYLIEQRLAGDIVFAARTAADGSVVGAFCEKA